MRKEGEKDYSPFMLLPGLVFLIVCLTKPELLKAENRWPEDCGVLKTWLDMWGFSINGGTPQMEGL
jgi:hypothetical protein